MTFERLNEKNIIPLKKYFSRPYGICDYTFGANYVWYAFFESEYAITKNDMLIISDGRPEPAFCYPIGEGDARIGIEELLAGRAGKPTRLLRVPAEGAELIRAAFPSAKVERMEQGFDYIYSAEDLGAMTGKKYHGIRNHINKFLSLYPDYEYKLIEEGDIPALKVFLEEYRQAHGESSESFSYECGATFRVLDNFCKTGMIGAAVKAGGKVQAFCMGQVIGDIMFVSIEKSSREVSSVSKLLVREFARTGKGMGAAFINREDDMGEPGLRYSKQQYNPCELRYKYEVSF